MVFIAALIAVEKLLPWKSAASWSVALLLAALALAIAIAADPVTGLTVPAEPMGSRHSR